MPVSLFTINSSAKGKSLCPLYTQTYHNVQTASQDSPTSSKSLAAQKVTYFYIFLLNWIGLCSFSLNQYFFKALSYHVVISYPQLKRMEENCNAD